MGVNQQMLNWLLGDYSMSVTHPVYATLFTSPTQLGVTLEYVLDYKFMN